MFRVLDLTFRVAEYVPYTFWEKVRPCRTERVHFLGTVAEIRTPPPQTEAWVS